MTHRNENKRLIRSLHRIINIAQTYFVFKSELFATRLGVDACCTFNGGKFISKFCLYSITGTDN